MADTGTLVKYDAGPLRNYGHLRGGASDFLGEAETRRTVHHVLHADSTLVAWLWRGEGPSPDPHGREMTVTIGATPDELESTAALGWQRVPFTLRFGGVERLPSPPAAAPAGPLAAPPPSALVVAGGLRISTAPLKFPSLGNGTAAALARMVETGDDIYSPLYLWSPEARKEAWFALEPPARTKCQDSLSVILKAYWAAEHGSTATAARKLRDEAERIAACPEGMEWWDAVHAHVLEKQAGAGAAGAGAEVEVGAGAVATPGITPLRV